MRWFEQQRMDWIAETLRIFGYINREHLCLKFGISVPQAANDFQQFQRERLAMHRRAGATLRLV
jgi:hypothetical protein